MKPQTIFYIFQFRIRRTQQKSPSFSKFTLDYHSSSITQNPPYSKIPEYHMENPLSHPMIINYPRNTYLHTTKRIRDHADDGIMEMIQQQPH